MSREQKARRTKLEVLYNGANISVAIERHLTNFTYTDNASGKADDLSITLEDRKDDGWGPGFPKRAPSFRLQS